jgi:hypothetical protein
VGDLPNVNFTTGLTSYNTSAMGATLGAGATSLLGPSRTALVIYSGEDDQTTDPDGKAGTRIACGVITAAANAGAQPAVSPVVPVVPKPVTSPVPAAPAPAQPAPAQPVPAKPAAVVSPTPVAAQVVPKPVVSVAPTASPVAVAQQPLPTAPPAAVAAPQSSPGGIGAVPALIIAVVGVGLVGAGWLLRRRGQLTR